MSHKGSFAQHWEGWSSSFEKDFCDKMLLCVTLGIVQFLRFSCSDMRL